MSGPEAKNPPPAGISAPDDLDVADLFEQLREELGRGAGGGGTESEFAATRALAERFWPVTAEREVGGGPKGLVKRFLRKLMRWYVEPLAVDQRVYNSSLLKLVDALSERADAAAASNARAQQLLRELEERLTRVERRDSAGSAVAAVPPVTVAAQPAAAALPDYFAFESRMRGSVDTSTTCGVPRRFSTSAAAAVSSCSSCARPASRRAGSTPTPTWSPTRGERGSTSSRPTSSSIWSDRTTAPSGASSWVRSSSTCRRPCSCARSSSRRRSCAAAVCSLRRRSTRFRRWRSATTSPT